MGKTCLSQTTWDKVKAEYVTGIGSLRQLAKKYGVSVSAISMQAKRKGWTRDREACEKIVRDKVIEQTAHIMINNNERAMKVVDTLLVKAEQASILLKPNDTRGMKEITAVLKELGELGAFEIAKKQTEVIVKFGEETEEYVE